jgi:hypothetical protein
MTIKKLKIALVTGALVLGGLAASAGARGLHGPERQAMKQQFDLDKNGKLDGAERTKLRASFAALHAQRRAEMLAKFDTNKNGKLDDGERTAMRETRAVQRFTQLDKNGDGKLTVDEFKAGRAGKHLGKHGGKHRGMRGHHRGIRKQP